MVHRQIETLKCTGCGQLIASTDDADFCTRCGDPYHWTCSPATCPRCRSKISATASLENVASLDETNEMPTQSRVNADGPDPSVTASTMNYGARRPLLHIGMVLMALGLGLPCYSLLSGAPARNAWEKNLTTRGTEMSSESERLLFAKQNADLDLIRDIILGVTLFASGAIARRFGGQTVRSDSKAISTNSP